MGVGAGLYMCDVVKKVHVRYLISWWVLVIFSQYYKTDYNTLIMVALCNRQTIIFSCCGLFFLLLFSLPNLSRHRLDVCHTSTHGVASANLKCRSEKNLLHAARSLKTQDAKKSPKIDICAPSHNFVGLYPSSMPPFRSITTLYDVCSVATPPTRNLIMTVIMYSGRPEEMRDN